MSSSRVMKSAPVATRAATPAIKPSSCYCSRLLTIVVALMSVMIFIDISFYTLLLSRGDAIVQESQTIKLQISEDIMKRRVVAQDFQKSFDMMMLKIADLSKAPITSATTNPTIKP